ncbi:calcium-binding protein [Candidatus Jidaibacter acanthamoebae]|nr:calcium-binding protein [Candidatus Jidaibacter acanthamoeba]
MEKKEQLQQEAHKAYENHIGPIKYITRPNGRVIADTHNTDVDAFRHAYASGVMAMEYGPTISDLLGEAYEIKNKWDNYNAPEEKKLSKKQMSLEKNMDLWNNRAGRIAANGCKSREEFGQRLAQDLKDGKLITDLTTDTREFIRDPIEVYKYDKLENIAKQHGLNVEELINLPGNEYLKGRVTEIGGEKFIVALPGEEIQLPESQKNESVVDQVMHTIGRYLNFTKVRCDPLVLDISGKGINLIHVDKSMVMFDLDGDGFKEKVGWIGEGSGLLVIDKNNDGIINNINELFGNQNTSGFADLRQFDKNKDGIINKHDEIYNKLRVWVDKNANGISEAKELFTLESLQIEKINLNSHNNSSWLNGNLIVARSTFTMKGKDHQIADIKFTIDPMHTEYHGSDGNQGGAQLENLLKINLRGYGKLASLHKAASKDSTLKNIVDKIYNIQYEELGNVNRLITELMYTWAECNDTTVTNGKLDLRKACFLEKFSATPARNTGNGVEEWVAKALNSAWKLAFNLVKIKILPQSSLKEIFINANYHFANDALILNSNIEDIITRAESIKIEDQESAVIMWEAIWLALNKYADKGKLSITPIIAEKIINILKTRLPSDTKLGSLEKIFASSINNVNDIINEWLLEGEDKKDLLIGNSKISNIIYGYGNNDILIGGKQSDKLYGGFGDDILEGGEGDDELYGEYGSDTYIWGAGLGNDIIFESRTDTDRDFVKLVGGITPEDIDYYYTNHNTYGRSIEIKIKSTGEKLLIPRKSERSTVSEMIFDNGKKVSLLDNIPNLGTDGDDVLKGTAYKDYLKGLKGNDKLYGGSGDDILEGGEGDDELYGEYGSDTYIWGAGLGNDIIFESRTDTDRDFVKLVGGITPEDIDYYYTNHNTYGRSIEIKIKSIGEKLLIPRKSERSTVSEMSFDNGKKVCLLDNIPYCSSNNINDKTHIYHEGNIHLETGFNNEALF